VAGKKGEGRERSKRHDPDEQRSNPMAAPANTELDGDTIRLLTTVPDPKEFVASVLSQVPESEQLRHYIEEIAEIPPLADEEEKELIKDLREPGGAGETARKRLNEGYLQLVVWISKEFSGGSVALPDLIDEGVMGLLEAVNSFEPGGEMPFSHYATLSVKKHISQALAEETRASRVPDYLLERITSIKKIARDLAEELQREPSQEEVADAMGLSLDELERLIKLIGHAESKEPSDQGEDAVTYDPTDIFEDYSEDDE
jgi:RNA polymerase primary sigma factor